MEKLYPWLVPFLAELNLRPDLTVYHRGESWQRCWVFRLGRAVIASQRRPHLVGSYPVKWQTAHKHNDECRWRGLSEYVLHRIPPNLENFQNPRSGSRRQLERLVRRSTV